MADGVDVGPGVRSRKRWSEAEKRRIVSLTTAPLASVAEVARAYGINANQVFKWRRHFEKAQPSTALLPVTVSANTLAESGEHRLAPAGGAINIELSSRAVISVEWGADPGLVRLVLECLSR